jgi:hypothetical protein
VKSAALGLLAAALVAAPLHGQELDGPRGTVCDDGFTTEPAIHVGETVRMEMREGERVEGRLLSCSGTVLVVDAAADSLRLVDVSELLDLDVAQPGSRTGGMIKGSLIGALGAVLFVMFAGQAIDGDNPLVAVGIGSFAWAMPMIGTAIGHGYPKMEWQPVSVRSGR